VTTIRVRARVGDDHRVVLTLPPEVAPGDYDIELTVRDEAAALPLFEVVLPDDRPKRFPLRPTNSALIPEYGAFERLLPELMKECAGKFVALRGGVVVAVGDTEIDVLTAAHRQSPGAPVYTRLVTDQPQPIPRINSSRVVRRESPSN
jgi:hypothetical protein